MHDLSIKKNANQKGTALTGGAVTEEVLASSDSIFTKTQYGGQKGLQQFYTPPAVSKLAKSVLGPRLAVLDPTAGDGSLLSAFDPPFSYGVEIDMDQVENAQGSYHAVKGDLQHVYSLLKTAGPQWDAIVANPPFNLQWSDPSVEDGKKMSSAKLTFIYLHRLLSEQGQFVFIDGRTHFYKHIADLSEAKGIYAIVEIDDLFPGTEHPCVIAFGMHAGNVSASHTTPAKRQISLEMVDLLGDWVRESRQEALGPYNHVSTASFGHYHLPDTFSAIQKEYTRRVEKRLGTNRRMFDAELVGGKLIQWLPSAYATMALRKVGDEHTFNGLNKLPIEYFATNERVWFRLLAHAEAGVVDLDPRLVEKVENIVGAIRRELVPLYEIKPQQRLGFLADFDSIKCVRSVDKDGIAFTEGEMYRLDTRTRTFTEDEHRVVESKKNPGEYEQKTYRVQRKAMEVTVGRWTFRDSGAKSSENIKFLIDHFDIPDPGQVSTLFPDEIARAERIVEQIYDEVLIPNSREWELENAVSMPFGKRRFQIEDIARLGFKRGGLLAWEQGLGKTVGGIAFSEYAVRNGAQDARLFITAGDLIPQWQREFKRFLGREATIIKTQAQAKKIAKYLRGGGTGLFLIHYEGLSLNGTQRSEPMPPVTVYEKEDYVQVKGTGRYGYYWVEEKDESDGEMDYDGTAVKTIHHPCKGHYDESLPRDDEKNVTVQVQYGYIPERYVKKITPITSKDVCPECRADVRNGWNGLYCEAEDDKGQKCGYVHYAVRVKPISSFLSRAFKHGVIVMDEATMIQGHTSKRSKAIRGMRSHWRLGMTGTPIKNYITQAFWVMWWSLGNASKRFPYGYEGSTKFENDFSVIEWEMTRGNKQNRKALPEVTNLSTFWRMLSSSTIRRRKEETGENLMPRFQYEIEVPLGTAQRAQQGEWLKKLPFGFPKFFEEKYPESKVVAANMHEIMAPMLGLQQKLDYALTIPEADPDYGWTGVPVKNWTPALLRTIELTMALAKQGKKVLVGSNLVATSEFVASALCEKGVKAIHILDADGKTADKKKRAERVYSFQTDDVQVFCAGVKAIRLGHNLDAAECVVLHGLDWDHETLDQFINRVHRLTSTKPIHVYVIVPKSDAAETLTAKKWALLGQKGGSIELALDGRLIDKNETQIDEAQIVREMMERGLRATGDEIEEDSVYELWAALPQLEQYEAPEGLIPAPPYEITEEGIAAAEAVGAFLTGKVNVPTDTKFDDLGSVEVEDVVPDELVLAQNASELDDQAEVYTEAAAIAEEMGEPMPEPPDETFWEHEMSDDEPAEDDAQLDELLAEMDAETTEAIEEAVAEVAGTETADDPTLALLAQMKEQMDAMKAQLDEERTKREALEARLGTDEQMSLFEVAA
jgi:predicted RNA methylase